MASRSTRILALPHSIPPCSCRSPLRLSRRVVNSPTSTSPLLASARLRHLSPLSSIPLSLHSRSLATHAATAVVPPPKAGPTKAYEDQITAGLIQPDDHQRSIITVLQDMYDSLETYSPPEIPEPLAAPAPTFFSKLFASTPTSSVPTIPPNVPKGLYLYGSVGCGKSYLMDLFYANLPAKWNGNKRRVHFHAFMMDVHLRGHRMKSEMEGDERDWIVHAARELAGEARILCFDEFQVTDIADAMILRRLMESLMGYGVVAVMTSNRTPDDLYKNGIQREQFVPCIELIKDRFVVQCLDSDIDYRKIPRALSKVYFHPLTTAHISEVDKLFTALTSTEEIETSRQLTVWGRAINVPTSTSNVAKFTFQDLCGNALSAADYLEITKTFETIFVTDVPQLGLNVKDQARRFILFIDAAYEAKTKLFILSDPPIHSVFSDAKADASKDGEISDYQRSVMDDLGLSAETVGASSIFTGEEEVFAFARAVSRLTEMGSVQWAQSSKGVPLEIKTAAEIEAAGSA